MSVSALASTAPRFRLPESIGAWEKLLQTPRLLAKALDGPDQPYYTPQLWAVQLHRLALKAVMGQKVEALEVLLDAGAPIEHPVLPWRVTAQETPPTDVWLSAARYLDQGCMAVLVRHGANLQTTDEYGQTALHYAAAEGNVTVMEFLANAGASFVARDCEDKTPVDYFAPPRSLPEEERQRLVSWLHDRLIAETLSNASPQPSHRPRF